MFRKQVGPREVAIAVVVVLAVVQFVYWRLLVYREPGRPPGGPAGGGGGATQPYAIGLKEVSVETLAGDEPGFADGPSWKARFCGPNALALDKDGTLLVADSRNHRIRRVTPGGVVTTIAGGGAPNGPGGQAEGPAPEARFRYPSGVAVTPDGAVLIADTGNHRICRLKDGTVSLLAGGSAGSRDGQGAAAQFQAPATLTLSPDGALWVLDAATGAIRRVDPAGRVTTPAAPAGVRAALGAEPAQGPVSAWSETWQDPTPTEFKLASRSAAAAAPGMPLVFGDRVQNVLLARGKAAPILIAGHLPPLGAGRLPQDADGQRATFGAPCAAVTAPDGTIYVVEYEGSRIRRVRLPEWLRSGEWTAPEPRARWRGRRGN